MLGAHQDSSALLLALAATLLVRSAILARRAQALHRTAQPRTAHGESMSRSAGKERV